MKGNKVAAQSVRMGRWTRFKKDYLRNWRLYCFLIIPIVYIVLFAYIPMAGVQIAFKDYNFTDGIWGSPWVGLENFERFFNAHNFWQILGNTLKISFYSLLASFPLPILLALLLNAFPSRRYKKIVQTISYMPHFISTVVIVGMLTQLLNPHMGIFGIVYSAITGKTMPDLMGSADAFKHLYVWSGIWQSVGWSSIIYIAALSSVDTEMHEAAEIDGATRVQRVWYIDLPAILPTATIMLILAAGGIMSVGFEKVYLMQNSLNISASEVISTYVYKVGMTMGMGDFSFATAIGLFNSVINFVLLVFVNAVSKKLSSTALW